MAGTQDGLFGRGSAPSLKARLHRLALGGLLLLWGGVAIVVATQRAAVEGTAGEGLLSVIVGLAALATGLGGLVWRFMVRLLDAVAARDLEFSRLAATDAMTGALNHAGFMEALERDVLRSQRYKHEFSLMRIDIDFFKRINDGYGHATGDDVIVSLASTVAASLRNVDALGRVGGASFAIGLPETPLDATEQLAERLRERIAGIEIATVRGDHVRFSVSVGVAALSAADADAEQLLVRAESALQRAKDNGRNRVEADRPETAPV
jgi:diguanylate cyclase (GGDEF)-like protein